MQIFVPRELQNVYILIHNEPTRAQNTISAIQEIKRLLIVVLFPGAGKNRALGHVCSSSGMNRHSNIRGLPLPPLQKVIPIPCGINATHSRTLSL